VAIAFVAFRPSAWRVSEARSVAKGIAARQAPEKQSNRPGIVSRAEIWTPRRWETAQAAPIGRPPIA
jgi:hypothetical protein